MVKTVQGRLTKLKKALVEELGEDSVVQFTKVPDGWKPPEGVEKYVVFPRGEYGLCMPNTVQRYPSVITKMARRGVVDKFDGVVLCTRVKFKGISRERLGEILRECDMRFKPWPRRSMVVFSKFGMLPKDDSIRYRKDMTKQEIGRYYR